MLLSAPFRTTGLITTSQSNLLICFSQNGSFGSGPTRGECGGKIRKIRELRFQYSYAAGRKWWVVAFAQIVATVYNRWTRNAPTPPPPTAWKFISASQFLLQPRMPPNCHCKVFIEHVSLNHLGVTTNPRSFNPSLWDGSANQHGGSLIGSMQVSSQHPPFGLVNHSLPKTVETIRNKILWGITSGLGIRHVSAVGNPF